MSRVDFRILVPGQRFRAVGPDGALSAQAWTFAACGPARRRGFFVVRTAPTPRGVEDQLTFQAGELVELVD